MAAFWTFATMTLYYPLHVASRTEFNFEVASRILVQNMATFAATHNNWTHKGSANSIFLIRFRNSTTEGTSRYSPVLVFFSAISNCTRKLIVTLSLSKFTCFPSRMRVDRCHSPSLSASKISSIKSSTSESLQAPPEADRSPCEQAPS